MNEVEVGRARGGALNAGRVHGGARGSRSVALAALSLALFACGDATCPKGSVSVDGRCEPAESTACDGGAESVDGACKSTSGVSGDGGAAGAAGSSTGPRMDGGTGRPTGSDGAVPPDDGAVVEADAAIDAAPVDVPEGDGGTEPAPDSGTGPVADVCLDYSCNDHGHCEVVDDQPSCSCDDGFAGARCAECEPGLTLEGAVCVPLCEATSAPDCGAHGSCKVEGNAATCSCVHPYAGPTCQECATGFKLDGTGACVPDCGVCAPHSFCDGTLMVPACSCYPGYAKLGTDCVWRGDGATGGIVNGDLTSGQGWTSSHVDFVDGEAVFRSSVEDGTNCDVGQLQQVLTMPTREQGEPFALELETATACASPDPELCPPLLVELGNSLTRVRVPGAPSNTSATHQVCLGDAGYGAGVQLRIRPGVAATPSANLTTVGLVSSASGFACNTRWPSLRRVRIVTTNDAACARESGLADQDFDLPAAWSLAGGASVVASAATLPVGATAKAPFLLRPRADMPSPALVFNMKDATRTTGRLEVRLDGLPIAALWGTTDPFDHYVCLPDWAQGTAHELELRAGPIAGVRVESIGIRNEPRCRGGAFDSNFVGRLGTGSWSMHHSSPPGSVTIDTRTSISYDSGTYSIVTAGTFLSATVRVPATTDTSGPALSYQARISAGATGRVEFYGQSAAPMSVSTVAKVDYERGYVCLDRIWRGQPMYVTAFLSATADVMRVDGFGVANSQACP